MIGANYKKKGLLAALALLAISSLAMVPKAEASSFSFYGHGEHEYSGSSHDGCGGGGGDSGDCVTSYYTSSFYAYDQDISQLMDGDITGLKSLSVSIGYQPTDLNTILLDSAKLYIKAKDDASGLYADSRSGDGYEFLDILKIEGQSVNVNAVEIDGSGWYFGFDVKQFVTGTHQSPLDFLLAVVNLSGCLGGQDDLYFQNARLDLAYHEVNCPPPNPVPLPASFPLMLSGLGLLGFALRRKTK